MQSKLYFRWIAFLPAVHSLTRQARDCSERKERVTNMELWFSQFKASKEIAYGAHCSWQIECHSAGVGLTLAESMLLKISWASNKLNGDVFRKSKCWSSISQTIHQIWFYIHNSLTEMYPRIGVYRRETQQNQILMLLSSLHPQLCPFSASAPHFYHF